jgi:hypothetical protein
MLFGQNRRELRHVFIHAWQKHRAGQPLEGAEHLIARVAERHPEYHALLDDAESVTRDWSPDQGESNPFLHMAMHLAIEEGLMLDEPRGVRALYQSLLGRFPDEHVLQHGMLDCLGEMLWQAQRAGLPPDTGTYLDCLRRLAR